MYITTEGMTLLAQALAKNGKVLNFKAGSVFEGLDVPNATAQDYAQLANEIAIRLKNDITLVRTKINPLVVTFAEKVSALYNSTPDANGLSGYTVRELSVPPFVTELNNSKVLKLPRAVQELSIATVSIPTPDVADIRKYFIPDLPSAAKVYAADLSDEYTDAELQTFWDSTLGNIGSKNSRLTDMKYNPLTNIKEIGLLIMLVSNIRNGSDLKLTLPEETVKNTLNDLYFELLNYAAIGLKDYYHAVDVNKLIQGRTGPTSIDVIKDTYSKYLEEGGSPETILGFILSDKISVEDLYLSSIKENEARYLELWKNKVTSDRYLAPSRNMEKYKTAYVITIRTFFKEVLPDDMKEYAVLPEATVIELFLEMANAMNYSDLSNIGYVAKELFGKLIFPKTNYLRFANAVVEQQKINPDADIQTAATLAILDITLDWLLEQVEIGVF